jgi:hypothetical protein
MSPRKPLRRESDALTAAVTRLWTRFGLEVRDARIARGWSAAELANRAGMSPAFVYLIESGRSGSAEGAARIAAALGRQAELDLVDPTRRQAIRSNLSADLVHSAMGEFEARRLRHMSLHVGIDEPYQHYQFAGRADLVAWNLERRALLHIENRTRFPDVQQTAGSYNAKRAYLGDALAGRLGITRWASETHVLAGLWSREVLHALRQRPETFRSICPSSIDSFLGWWSGAPPDGGRTSVFAVLDPLARGRQRPFIGLEGAMAATARYRGYSDAADAIKSAA